MNDFLSQEMNSARVSPSSFTDNSLVKIDTESLKNDLKVFLVTKDKTLLKPYEMAALSRSDSELGNDTLKSFLNVLKDYCINKFREDNAKNLMIRKNFDIMFLALDNLIINNINITSNEVNAIMVSFISKNFL